MFFLKWFVEGALPSPEEVNLCSAPVFAPNTNDATARKDVDMGSFDTLYAPQ